MEIPRSEWVLKCNYFKVRLVSDFTAKYINYAVELGQDRDDPDMLDFLDYITSRDDVELYQFPPGIVFTASEDEHDYFERFDDNHVIPRCLFKPI